MERPSSMMQLLAQAFTPVVRKLAPKARRFIFSKREGRHTKRKTPTEAAKLLLAYRRRRKIWNQMARESRRRNRGAGRGR